MSDFRVFKNILGRFLVVIVAFCDRLKLILNHFTENKKVSDFVHHSESELRQASKTLLNIVKIVAHNEKRSDADNLCYFSGYSE